MVLFGLALIDTMGTSYGRLRRFPAARGYLLKAVLHGEDACTYAKPGTCLVGPVLLAWFLDVATLLLSCFSIPSLRREESVSYWLPFFSVNQLLVYCKHVTACIDASDLVCHTSWMQEYRYIR